LALADHYLQEEIMELQLKNIGMIKEANVKLDGLTVIAGENDTGKSTVGKALYAIVKSLHEQSNNIENEDVFSDTIDALLLKLFKTPLKSDSHISIKIDNDDFYIRRDLDSESINSYPKIFRSTTAHKGNYSKAIVSIFVETPLVWNFIDTFKNTVQIGHQTGIRVDIPYLMNDLAIKLANSSISNSKIDISDITKDIMQGNFRKDEMGRFYFDKQGKKIDLLNTATGIKTFGIFQVLSQNNWLNENTVLILDEPEVHLHPKWQLEMAKIIVELVKKGVKIVVNSHSPYMIQALIKYARDKDIVDKSNFYLTEKIDDYAVINNVNDELNRIFELLAEPMNEVFEL